MVGNVVFQFFSRTIPDLKCAFPSGGERFYSSDPVKI